MGKTNYAVAVHDAVYWAVWRAVYWAVYWAVNEAMDGAVYGAVDNAVSGAGYGAVADAVWGDPDHPALQDFLRKTSPEAETEA